MGRSVSSDLLIGRAFDRQKYILPLTYILITFNTKQSLELF